MQLLTIFIAVLVCCREDGSQLCKAGERCYIAAVDDLRSTAGGDAIAPVVFICVGSVNELHATASS